MSALFNAMERVATNFPGGRDTLLSFLKLQKSPEAWRKEIEGSMSHKLGAKDALAGAKAACQLQSPHCYDYAMHVAEECGGRFVISEAQQGEAKSPVQKISCLMRETSHVTQVVLDAMTDGVVSDNELEKIEDEIAQAEEVLRKLRQAARAVNEACKPVALRSAS